MFIADFKSHLLLSSSFYLRLIFRKINITQNMKAGFKKKESHFELLATNNNV